MISEIKVKRFCCDDSWRTQVLPYTDTSSGYYTLRTTPLTVSSSCAYIDPRTDLVTTDNSSNLYSDFLQSIKERDARVEASVVAALAFLYKGGYVTKEEYLNKESERLYDIKSYDRSQGGMNIMFIFDKREWFIGVEVDSMLNIIRAEFHILDGEYQVLYERK